MTIHSRVFFILTFCLIGCAASNVEPSTGPTQSPMPVVSRYVKEHGALSSPVIDAYLRDILTLALTSMPQKSSKTFQISVLDTGKPIAFTPGVGFILISRGLVEHLKYEGEFFFVLTHEIAHEVLGHTSSENFYSKDPKARELLELQADQLAVIVTARAGYDPALSLRALKDAYEDLTEEQYSTVYPSQEVRTEALSRFLLEIPAHDQVRDNNRFKTFKRSLS